MSDLPLCDVSPDIRDEEGTCLMVSQSTLSAASTAMNPRGIYHGPAISATGLPVRTNVKPLDLIWKLRSSLSWKYKAEGEEGA